MTHIRRHRGTAGGWIIILVIIAVLAGIVVWKMASERSGHTGATPTTMHD